MTRICHAPGGESAAHGVFELGLGFSVPSRLRETGMQESALDKACEMTLSNPYRNPGPIEREPLRALLQNAWNGKPPRTCGSKAWAEGLFAT
jgi:maleylacetate reductase